MVPIRYNVRSLVVRRSTTLATALGMALVVFVLAASMMLSNGIKKTLTQSGRSDVAVVLRKGSNAELESGVDTQKVSLILAQPQVKKDESGAPMGVGEVVVVISQDRMGKPGHFANLTVRGVPANVWSFRPEVRIIEGRPLKAGTDEVVIGQSLRGKFRGMQLGETFELKKNRPATVVGIFADGGSSLESEVWADVDQARATFGRETSLSSVRAWLTGRDAFDAFKTTVEGDKQLGLQVLREDEYFEKLSEGMSGFVSGLGISIAIFFSFAAIIGAVITMYASVANRQKEIGTLRALGFSKFSILSSFVLESALLAISGGVLGALAATSLGFVKLSMMSFASFSEVTFGFSPTPGILLFAVLFGGMMGVAGGFFPAVRAARVSPTSAMRGG